MQRALGAFRRATAGACFVLAMSAGAPACTASTPERPPASEEVAVDANTPIGVWGLNDEDGGPNRVAMARWLLPIPEEGTQAREHDPSEAIAFDHAAIAGDTDCRACHPEQTEAASPSAPACPPHEVIEAIHGSAFHFQHGPEALALDRLELARGLADATGPAREPLAALERIAGLAGPERVVATEEFRLWLSDWACLSERSHAAFHRRLPAID